MRITGNDANEILKQTPVIDDKIYTEALRFAFRQGLIVVSVVFIVILAIQLFAYFINAISEQNSTQFLINIIVIPNVAGGAWFWWKRKRILEAVERREKEIIRMMTE